MTKFYLICTFLCVQFSTNSYGQSRNDKNSIFDEKQYEDSLLSYERVYFELSEFQDTTISNIELQQSLNACLLKKLLLQKSRGYFEEAIQTSSRFDLKDLKDSSQFILRYETVVCYILAGQYDNALGQMEQFQYYVTDSTLKYKTDIWKILALTYLNRYAEAKENFKVYVARNKLDLDVEKVFYFEKNPNLKNEKKAQTLATFIPGAGMLYLGNTKEGIISLGLQLATLGFAGYNFWNGYYLSGFLTGFGLFQAFYFGGIRRTEILTRQYNEKKSKEYVNNIKSVLWQSIK